MVKHSAVGQRERGKGIGGPSTVTVLIAQMKQLSGRRVMLVLSEEILGLARQERALASPIVEPGT